MSIESTNRVSDPSRNLQKVTEGLSIRKEIHAGYSKKKIRKNALKFFHIKPATCSKCKRGMDRKLAKTQIQNKREDAPICIPCIMGVPRIPLPCHIIKEMEERKNHANKTKEKTQS